MKKSVGIYAIIFAILSNINLVEGQINNPDINKKDSMFKVKAQETFKKLRGTNQDNEKLLSQEYKEFIKLADNKYKIAQFDSARYFYLQALTSNNDLGQVKDRFKLACSFTEIGQVDNAFLQLFRIAKKGHYANAIEIEGEKHLIVLHKDKRWEELIAIIETNQEQDYQRAKKMLEQ